MTSAFVNLACALLAIMLAVAGSAAAQDIACGPHNTVVMLLRQYYSEQVQALGITSTGELVEIFVSPRGTWTVVMTTPSGPSCLVTAGVDWQMVPMPQPPDV